MTFDRILPVLQAFNTNWNTSRPDFRMVLTSDGIDNSSSHPLQSELRALVIGLPSYLPYFGARDIDWCTLAPSAEQLREMIVLLNNWILPSLGWKGGEGGLVSPRNSSGQHS